jgi:hypothetical protein
MHLICNMRVQFCCASEVGSMNMTAARCDQWLKAFGMAVHTYAYAACLLWLADDCQLTRKL